MSDTDPGRGNGSPPPPPPPLIRRHLMLSESGAPIFAPPSDTLPTESDPPDASLPPSSSLYESDSLPPSAATASEPTANAPGQATPPHAFPPPVARVAGPGPDPGRAAAPPPTGNASPVPMAPVIRRPTPQARTSGPGPQPGLTPPVAQPPPVVQVMGPGAAPPPAAPVIRPPVPQSRTSGPGPAPGLVSPPAANPYQASPPPSGRGTPYGQQHGAYMPSARPAIGANNLQHMFPGSGFQLWIPQLFLMPGELTYIGGASGSGKSTLIRFLAMENKLEHGDIWVMDRPLRGMLPNDLADLKGEAMTYIPQGHLGLTDTTATENIARVLYDFDGMSMPQARQQATLALRMVGLADEHHNKRVKLLSGGQQARVAIAKVFARGRPICLSDEILPALDDRSRLAVLRLFQQLITAGGFTVAIIAHQPELQKYFQRVIEMSDGKIISDKRQTQQPIPQTP